MDTNLAVKITDKIFCFHLIGFEQDIIYSTVNRSLMLTDHETGAPIKIVEKDEDLLFEDFILVARNMLLDTIEISN